MNGCVLLGVILNLVTALAYYAPDNQDIGLQSADGYWKMAWRRPAYNEDTILKLHQLANFANWKRSFFTMVKGKRVPESLNQQDIVLQKTHADLDGSVDKLNVDDSIGSPPKRWGIQNMLPRLGGYHHWGPYRHVYGPKLKRSFFGQNYLKRLSVGSHLKRGVASEEYQINLHGSQRRSWPFNLAHRYRIVRF